jgi:hypothetical protein
MCWYALSRSCYTIEIYLLLCHDIHCDIVVAGIGATGSTCTAQLFDTWILLSGAL